MMGNSMDKVLPGLYLSGYEAAQDLDLLRRHGITHVVAAVDRSLVESGSIDPEVEQHQVLWADGGDLSILTDRPTGIIKNEEDSGCPRPCEDQDEATLHDTVYCQRRVYLLADVADSPFANIRPHFSTVNSFIHSARTANEVKQPRNVLVHCMMGASRSPTLVMAYLMSAVGLSWINALRVCKAQRNSIVPNKGFLRQLQEFQKEGLCEERYRLLQLFGKDKIGMDVDVIYCQKILNDMNISWHYKKPHGIRTKKSTRTTSKKMINLPIKPDCPGDGEVACSISNHLEGVTMEESEELLVERLEVVAEGGNIEAKAKNESCQTEHGRCLTRDKNIQIDIKPGTTDAGISWN